VSAYCLLCGILHRNPTLRTGKESGHAFMTALLRCETGENTLWANVAAFDESAQAELLRLKTGDAVSIQGGMKVSIFEKNGEHRASLDVVASQVTALRRIKPQKGGQDAQGGGEGPMASRSPAFDDAIPEW
jgi:single-stranded DNA-binding protein